MHLTQEKIKEIANAAQGLSLHEWLDVSNAIASAYQRPIKKSLTNGEVSKALLQFILRQLARHSKKQVSMVAGKHKLFIPG
ncbi:hypothetical protein EQG49_12640 [Periweissella cryptocerci]|uniref:Uncharacterized protein n=1 Tax=Periweissella cryptocerci TaxID=2506420 RepID=A0A4V1AIZ7_9LACO|nr:hypothetical protein [Periweissella cryptocerci]QBO37245.1 hypothetical protein EQG49_12640 [Periweissella cryptocerci]